MKLTLKEMNGLLNGKCLPSDLIVGETLAEYLVRKFAEADAKCAALAAENAGLKNAFGPGDAVLNFLTIALRHTTYDQIDLDDVTLAFKMSLPETTATDAFLAEVRAQGVEMFASVLESRGRHQDYAEIAELERDETQLITERDSAEQALADMYEAAMGERPEWSNLFGYAEAIDDVAQHTNLLDLAAAAGKGE